MTTIREYQFIVGAETDTLPVAGTPADSNDLITLGYADDHYVQGGQPVADVTALQGIAAADRADGDVILVKSTNTLYRFDSASAATADGTRVVQPTSGTGRWFRIRPGETASNGDYSVTGTISIGGNANITGDVTVTGDATINGTLTTINSTTLEVADANITVNKGGTVASADSAGAGITVEMSDAADAKIAFSSAVSSRFLAGTIGAESEIITASNTQTMTGQKIFDLPLSIKEVTSTPSAPASGYQKIYPKSDGFYRLDDSGVEQFFGAQSLSLIPALFTFNTWNPVNVTGTETDANSLGTDPGDLDVTFSALSSGTVTVTFPTAGTYEFNMAISHKNGANFSTSRLRFTYGGTAQVFNVAEWESRLVVPGGANNANYSGTDHFIIEADANETLTVRGRFLVVGDTPTSSYQATARAFIKRLK